MKEVVAFTTPDREQDRETDVQMKKLQANPAFAKAALQFQTSGDTRDWDAAKSLAQRITGLVGPALDKVLGLFSNKENKMEQTIVKRVRKVVEKATISNLSTAWMFFTIQTDSQREASKLFRAMPKKAKGYKEVKKRGAEITGYIDAAGEEAARDILTDVIKKAGVDVEKVAVDQKKEEKPEEKPEAEKTEACPKPKKKKKFLKTEAGETIQVGEPEPEDIGAPDVAPDVAPEPEVPENAELPDPEEVGEPYQKTTPTYMVQMDEDFEVETLEGVVTGKAGDYLAKGPLGELYPIDATVHAESYKPFEEEEAEEEVPEEPVEEPIGELPDEEEELPESVKLEKITEDDEIRKLISQFSYTGLDRFLVQAEARAMRLCDMTKDEAQRLLEKLTTKEE